MRSVELTNYRCFQNIRLEFKDGVNLFVGDNASGKTTILRALRAAMSAFFSGYSDGDNTVFSGLSKNDFTIRESDYAVLNERPIEVSFDWSDYMGYPNIMPQNYATESTLRLVSKKSSTQRSGIKDIRTYGRLLKDGLFDTGGRQVMALPLFASFSTDDIHSKKRSIKRFNDYKHKPSFGYYACLHGDGLFEYWRKRLLILAEAGKGEREIAGVTNAIIHALGPDGCNVVSNMTVRPMKGCVYYHFVDGREIEAEYLSDGYLRLASIVTDIAFRCALLNQGVHGDDACRETRGTVLIDEIDLHLHPTLQSSVIGALQRTFPNLQFIVTTHAPMVMTGIESSEHNQVCKLGYTQENGYTCESIQTYGMDASTIIEVGLNHSPRDKNVDEKLTELFEKIDNDYFDEASVLLNGMREQFGYTLPELTKAETLLNLLNSTPDDKD